MTNASVNKGYFNALTSSSFKTMPDGRRLFFPWGVLGGGYIIATEEDYQPLRQQMKAYTITSLVLIIGSVIALTTLAAFAVAALLIVAYAAWMPFLLRGLQRSQERLSLTESMTSQARTHHTATLWALQIVALAFVVIGAVMIVMTPDQRLAGVASVLFFGVCAGIFARMLMLRRQA